MIAQSSVVETVIYFPRIKILLLMVETYLNLPNYTRRLRTITPRNITTYIQPILFYVNVKKSLNITFESMSLVKVNCKIT